MKKYLIVIIFFISNIIFAQQEQQQNTDIKVGLVLSGGGAKGYAHVGVLKVIEQTGVRIDYIAGTSMGAIVGGLYAAGYNAHQLDSILTVHDFSELTNDESPRRAYSFYQKKNKGKYAISLPINKWKVGLPKSISKGQSLFNLLSQLTEHVHHVKDFSKLSTPFFCIATGLETGEEVVLDNGFLPEAIRASSSFPTVYAPVEIDGKILVDGGIVNNYPIDRLKSKGVDYIIGVDVQGKLFDNDKLTSAPLILMQIVGYQMYQNLSEKIKMTDLYLKPDISTYNNFSFALGKKIIKTGEDIASEHITELKRIASKQKGLNNNNKDNVNLNSYVENRVIIKVEIMGNENYTNHYCLDKLKIEIGKTIIHKEFIKGIDALSATGNFESIQYRFIHEIEGVKVEIKLIENKVSTFVKLGAHYDDLYKTGILVNFTKKHPFLKNDFISADFVIGDNLRYNIDYFIDNGSHWSYGINTRYNAFNFAIFGDEEVLGPVFTPGSRLKIPIKYSDATTQFYVQTTFRNKFAFQVGAEYKGLRASTDVIVDNQKEKQFFEKSGYGNLYGKLTFDNYTEDYFPKKGVYFEANYKTYLIAIHSNNNFQPFSQLYGKLSYAHTFFDKLTIHFTETAGATIGSNENVINNYALGGNNENFVNTFEKFYGYDIADLRASSYIKSELIIRYEIFKNNYISFTGNFAEVEDNLWDNLDFFQNIKSGYAIGYGLKTIIGPVELKYTWSPDNNEEIWFVNIGYWF
ncbi:MAG: patatin-like phospholipase family protein [Flavobacteriaceae bacterium]|nr:patatin-like phospholipase family protein [Flavobacteriaceae bacterium]